MIGLRDDSMDRKQKGFTLIECLVSIAVLSIAIASLSSVTVAVIKENAFSRAKTTANALATDKIEALKNISYSNVASGGPETVQTVYTRQWTVTTDSPAVRTKTIVVTVSWNWLGKTRNVTLKTIITR